MEQHKYAISLVAGVISSLIAIGLVELYRWLRKTFNHRVLKRVLQLHPAPCIIVAPIFNNPNIDSQLSDSLMHYRDAYAFGHLFSLCHRIGVEPSFVPYNKVSENEELPDIFCVGGPLSNKETSFYLSRYVRGLCMIDASGVPTKDWHQGGHFRIGQKDLFETKSEQYAILTKITEMELGQERTVHLLFGYSAMATASASYYLWKHFANIHKYKGKHRYCIAVKLVGGENYKSVQIGYEDHTDAAFLEADEPSRTKVLHQSSS
jgi:hypothetical protein